jgi:hypothetical protein
MFRFSVSLIVIIGTAKYFTARRSIYGLSRAVRPQSSRKRVVTQNNIAARIIYCHRVIPAQVPIGTICFRYPFNIYYVCVIYWSQETHSKILRMLSEHSTEHEFCTHCILLWRRGNSTAGVRFMAAASRRSIQRVGGCFAESKSAGTLLTFI